MSMLPAVDESVLTRKAYDARGRRTFYRETENGQQVTFTRFLYDGYVMIQQVFSNSPYNIYKEFVWDPTESVATKPLCFRQHGQADAYLMHDGNKNVTDVIAANTAATHLAHYDYAPFGEMTMRMRGNGWGSLDPSALNPWCFSSEYAEDVTATVYYNYRHYNSYDAKWLCRDSISESYVANKYLFVHNDVDMIDVLGLAYGNPVSGPNGPVGSGWGPYYPNPWELPDNSPWYEKLPDCPCALSLDCNCTPLENQNLGADWSSPNTEHLHGHASYQLTWSGDAFGPGQQCMYDADGKLINVGDSAGTPDYIAHNGFPSPKREALVFLHLMCDGWYCIFGTDFDHYMRPPNKGRDTKSGQPCPINDGCNVKNRWL